MEKGKGFSTEYEDHQGLIRMLAQKCWGRMQAANTPVEVEDIIQQMSLTYVKCLETFKPENGVTFTAYFGRSCINNFNKWAEKQIAEQTTLGLVRFEELSGEDEGSSYDFIDHEGSESMNPETILMRKQEAARGIRDLSPTHRAIVRELLEPSEALMALFEADNRARETRGANPKKEPTFAFVCNALNMSRADIANAREAFDGRFGVRI